ncbi:MAG TPA: thioesterase family protein [Terracidiphilus sp.]|nr:thioesterase family protein [Terracidiphilus sp.]
MTEGIVADEAQAAPVPLHYTWMRRGAVSQLINFYRIPALAIRQRMRPLPPLGVLEEDRVRMRVWPNDIDLNFHMNNARYLSVMDYARTHLLARAGLLDHILRSRWQALVGAVWMTYRRSLPLFASFTITSRLVCWDVRWFYIEQTFTSLEGLAAIGWVKGALRDASGAVDPNYVIARVAPGIASPPMPDTISTWNELTREKLQSA